MSKASTAIALFTGIIIGGVSVWYVTREHYAQLAEDEINSVKDAYANMEHKKMKELGEQFAEGLKHGLEEEPRTPVVTTKLPEKGGITKYAERIKNGAPMEYSKTVVPSKLGESTEESKSNNIGEHPYVISPEEFGDLDYNLISLTYFADSVLSDEYGTIVDDICEIVGDALDHFGEYEDDSVYARNDAKRCDYEILRDERNYDEFLETLPRNI